MMEREQLRTVSTVEAVSTALEEDIYALRYEMGAATRSARPWRI